MTVDTIIQDFLDPRGRMSRKGLLVVATAMLVVDIAMLGLLYAGMLSPTGCGVIGFKLMSVWVASAAVSKRLHDLGLSAWWLAKGLVALMAWSIVVAIVLLTRFNAADALNPANVAFWLNAGLSSAPALAALLWLHFARGEPGENRYGPAPDASGFARADLAPVLGGGRDGDRQPA